MFLKPSEFKKLLEDAYKTSGFKLYNTGIDMLITGDYWIVQVRNNMMSNKIKSLIIELSGEFPKEGDQIVVRKGELNTYQEADDMVLVTNVYKQKRNEMQPVNFTRLIYDSPWKTICFMNVYDSLGKTSQKILMQERIRTLIDADYIEEEKSETYIEQPAYDSATKMVYWNNNAMTIGVCIVSAEDSDSDLKQILEEVKDIPLKEWI